MYIRQHCPIDLYCQSSKTFRIFILSGILVPFSACSNLEKILCHSNMRRLGLSMSSNARVIIFSIQTHLCVQHCVVRTSLLCVNSSRSSISSSTSKDSISCRIYFVEVRRIARVLSLCLYIELVIVITYLARNDLQ